PQSSVRLLNHAWRGRFQRMNHGVSSLGVRSAANLVRFPEDFCRRKEPYPKPKGKEQRSGSGVRLFAFCHLVFALCLDSSSGASERDLALLSGWARDFGCGRRPRYEYALHVRGGMMPIAGPLAWASALGAHFAPFEAEGYSEVGHCEFVTALRCG